MRRHAACLLAGMTAVLITAGCSDEGGPKTMRVWGKVTVDGAPLDEGTIDFVSSDGSPPAQGQIKAGEYDIAKPAGPVATKVYRVEISALKDFGKPLRNVMGDAEPTMQPKINTIAPEYNVESKLTVTVSDDSAKNNFDFAVKQGAKPAAAPR
ncbi:MAG: hypothetical protein U0835_12255 [Isosphaeraceae bacterium]